MGERAKRGYDDRKKRKEKETEKKEAMGGVKTRER